MGNTKIRGRQIETDDFIKSARNADVDWSDDRSTASQLAIARLVGESSDRHFTYEWVIASTSITITHNLGKHPAVTVVDTGGNEFVCGVDYIDNNTVRLTFSQAIRGTAYFN